MTHICFGSKMIQDESKSFKHTLIPNLYLYHCATQHGRIGDRPHDDDDDDDDDDVISGARCVS
jgi:hypothetical protein